ncbi:hypothetical protein OG599_05630 [Streptomyces sp. NBC_01335]|uniref:hypothetical protein n=1 Tax=Streptomyces sp. NBC_01335 TaxID=2903828 RepID=UPI002E115D74|nr:hypothetical protein OG599_05630 [Streptomyces sp. NBC_01335]
MSFLVFVAVVCLFWFFLLPLKWQTRRLAGPDPALQKAAAAARRQKWEPAALLLADAGEDWERRALYSDVLGRVAALDGDGWLLAWEAARPYDPDAAVVRARARIAYAWKLRGAMRATATSRARFARFHQALWESRDDLVRAAGLNPADPTPHVAEIWMAMGLSYPNRDMHLVWREITERAPYHFDAHLSALQYWCAKWHGSKQIAHDFAEKAARNAPAGSLLVALPLIAWFENSDMAPPAASFTSPRVRAMVDAALVDMAAAPDDHPRLPYVRHLVGYVLVHQGRYREAVAQFRHVDGCLNALPWRYLPSPLDALRYRALRTRAARRSLLEKREKRES